MTYKERAVAILSLFLTDYTKEELFECADAAYSQTKFGAEPVPLRKVNESTDVLELWHGRLRPLRIWRCRSCRIF